MEATFIDAPDSYSGNRLIIFTSIFVPIQIVCVAFRYLARYLVKGSWGLDDIVVMTSLIMQICLAGLCIGRFLQSLRVEPSKLTSVAGSVKNAGVGYHAAYLEKTDPSKLMQWGKYLLAISTLTFGCVNLPKLAILALFHRLFPNKSNRTAVYVLMATLILLLVSLVTATLAACHPFAANWNLDLPDAHCVNKEALFRYGSLPNIITDGVMLVLPLRVTWNLQTTTRLKVGLTITFLIGSL